MKKILGIMLAGAVVSGCALDRNGEDWSKDCMRNHSETSAAYSKCMEKNAESAANGEGRVGLSNTVHTGGIGPASEGKATDFQDR